MSLHKLTAGDGYTYLTRQVAAADATHRGRDGLGEYYSQKGECPGVWLGHGADGLTRLAAPTQAFAGAPAPGAAPALRGEQVSETQMLALFGEGRHPNAEAIEKQLITDGHGVQAVLAATRLGSPYKVVNGPSAFRVELAKRFEQVNADAGLPRDWPIPESERAFIRTQLGRELFIGQYGRAPLNSRELSGLLARAGRQQSTAVAGYDLTFTPVKSVSALWAVAPREVAQVIEQAHQSAVEQCLTWLEDNAAYTRLGRGAVRQVEVRGLIAAAFTHRDSRAGDPNLHTHVAVSNKVQVAAGPAAGADAGRWLALDGRPLHKLAVAASERYNTRLEALLRDKLGVEFTERAGDPGKRAVREIVGLDERLLNTWSARRLMIEVRRGELAAQFQTRHGRPPGPVEAIKLAQQATLETRQAKHEPRSHAEQRQAWRADALRVLGTPQALTAMLDGALQGLRDRRDHYRERPREQRQAQRPRSLATDAARGPDLADAGPIPPGRLPQRRRPQRACAPAARTDTPGWVADTAERVLRTVQTTRATWQQAHVRAEAERAVRAADLPLARVDAAVERIVAAALSPAWSLPLGVHEPVSEPAALRRRDGTSVYATAGAQMFTSPEVVAAEKALLALARRTGGRTVSAEALELALLDSAAKGVTLNPGQSAMVRALASSGNLLQLALAPAGTGKTTAMWVLAGAWRGDGGTVIGLAPSAAAAAALGQQTDSTTDTLAKLIWSLDTLDQQAGRVPADAPPRGPVPAWVPQIGAGTLVIIDEAGMAGTRDLARAAQWLAGRGAVLRLVGDDAQLAAVGAGGVLRDIAETAGALTLSQVVRFTDPAEGAASLALRAGERAAIGFYIDNDRVHVADPTTSVDAAYQAWTADRQAGKDTLMLAPTRTVAAELNARARAHRIAERSSDGTTTGADPEVALADGSTASAGDTVVTRRNNRRLALSASDWVKNGDRWTVRQALPDGALRVQHLGTRRVITLPADYARAHIALGYASTVHGAQGSTADTCHTVASGAEDRQLLYVAMTRGRESNHLYLATAGDGDEHSVLTPDALLPPTAVDLLTRILGRDGAQVSATTAQRQLADPAVRLGAAADRYHDSLHVAALERLGNNGVAALDEAAEQALPGLTAAPAWVTLRASLALRAANETSPDTGPDTSADISASSPEDTSLFAVHAAVAVLHRALARGEVGSAADPAAVLDWRHDLANPRPVPALNPVTQQSAGPLAWLPAIPLALETDQSWGIYLQARHGYTTYLAEQVAERARAWTPTSAPAWATPLLGTDGASDLLAPLAVWRAVNNVDDSDLRPTGPRKLPVPDLREQRALDARITRALGEPAAAANRWRTLAQQVEARLLDDPYWPVLAGRLAAADRAGIDVDALVRSVIGATCSAAGTAPAKADQPLPLPDEQPAAALWWRLARHIAPAALAAHACDLGPDRAYAPSNLRPSWTPHLVDLLGEHLAGRVVADPAWPALVAAATQASDAGWTPEQILTTTYELLHDAHQRATTTYPGSHSPDTPDTAAGPPRLRPAELATALVWRVALLTDAPSDTDTGCARDDENIPVDPEQVPLDPAEQDMLPPEDLYDGLDEASESSLQDSPADLQLPQSGEAAADPLPDLYDGDDSLAALTEQEPADTSHQHTGENPNVEQDPPAWLALAPVRDELAGQEQLRRTASGPDITQPDSGPADTADPAAADNISTPLVPRERLLELNGQARDFFAGAYPGSWAQQHLHQRLGTDLLDDPRFTPGYAPAGWTHLVEHLRARGATDGELIEAGLATTARTGRLIDRFRDRLILPIQTLDSSQAATAPEASTVMQVIGFVGRRHPNAVDGPDGSCQAGPKYLNTHDNLVFSKGAQLFGIAEAAAALAAGAVPVLVEGPLDALAITLATGGDGVGVAPLGTAFTDAQTNTLRPYLRQDQDPPTTLPASPTPEAHRRPTCGVVVATDADAPGRKAAERAYWQLVARGANPGRLALADGLDPAELLTGAGPQALRDALSAARQGDSTLARTLITDRVARYANRLHTAEGTVHAIRAAAKVIGALPPEHWLEHITHLDTLVDAAPGITHMEVIDAGLAWTADNTHDPYTAPRMHRPPAPQAAQPAPEIAPAADEPAAGLYSSPANDNAHSAGEPGSRAPTPRTSATADEPTERKEISVQWTAATWHDVGYTLDPRLIADTSWPALSAALERASRNGYDVQDHLPRLAAQRPLPDNHPARALRLRLITDYPQAATPISAAVEAASTQQATAERPRRGPQPPRHQPASPPDARRRPTGSAR